MNTPPKTLLFGLIVVIVLACLAGAAVLWSPVSVAEKAAAKLRVGMTLEEATEATGLTNWISKNASRPLQCSDNSWLNVEFSVAPHQVVAIHAYPPDLRRGLRAKFPFLQELLPVPFDPVRQNPRPLRPQPPEKDPR